MRAYASSLHAWKALERQEGIRVPHGLVFPLAVVEAIGRPHGLLLDDEEHHRPGPEHDAVFISVLDSRCMVHTAEHFRAWGLPLRRRDRDTSMPLVWAGGQGLHNPLPYSEIADLIVIGDAEDPLPALLGLWDRHGNGTRFLEEAAAVPGVYVPTLHDPARDIIIQSVASDIGITLREEISVSLDGTRRMEAARGCRFRCTFCSLGHRTPYRENPAADVIAAIEAGPARVHVQAGDIESHTGITEIRQAIRDRGAIDQSWTGRLDSLLERIDPLGENPDAIPGHKRYALGVEAPWYRGRLAVGKGYLTDERLVSGTLDYFAASENDHYGRAAWHMIAGLPGEKPAHMLELMRVLRAIDDGWRGRTRRNLELKWQPFQPLPGTPMQWCGAGSGARRQASLLAGMRMDWVKFSQTTGRTDGMARVCTVLSRSSGEPAARLLERLAEGPVAPREAEEITGTTCGPLDPGLPLPWDFVQTHSSPEKLRRRYEAMMRRLLA